MQKMSENEAITYLESIKDTMCDSLTQQQAKKSIDMAIQALEKQSIVNEIMNECVELKKELDAYKEIGTLNECREAVERMKPKTPTYDGDGYVPDGTFVWDEWLCPNCNSRYDVDFDEYDYCPNCGQKILWEKSNEENEHTASH